jgi:hypothetical protein
VNGRQGEGAWFRRLFSFDIDEGDHMQQSLSILAASCVIGGWARLLAVSCAFNLAGCADVIPAPLHGGSYVLAEHQQAALGGGVSVLYDRFEDSRCPKNVYCIQAGKLSYHFILSGPAGKESFELVHESERVAAKTLPGVRFGMSYAGARERPTTEHAVVLEVVVQPAAAP